MGNFHGRVKLPEGPKTNNTSKGSFLVTFRALMTSAMLDAGMDWIIVSMFIRSKFGGIKIEITEPKNIADLVVYKLYRIRNLP